MTTVVDSVWAKQGDKKTQIYFCVLADNVDIDGRNLKEYIHDVLLKEINTNADNIDTIKTSLGNLLNTDQSFSQVVSDIQKEVDDINKRDFANSIAPAKFTYDKTINALKLTFDK